MHIMAAYIQADSVPIQISYLSPGSGIPKSRNPQTQTTFIVFVGFVPSLHKTKQQPAIC